MLNSRYITLSEAAVITGGSLLGKDRPIGPALRTDSRKIGKGDGFIALPGGKTDGHAFIDDAISKGASYIIMEGKFPEASRFASRFASRDTVSFLIVDDTSAALRDMAAHVFWRKSSLREVIAVTGTAGKTTTRECIFAVLRNGYRVHAARESYNTWIGCALTILEMPLETEILILEMGTNHPGEIPEIAASYPPTMAVITAVGPGHLEGLSDVTGVLEEKMGITGSPGLKCLFFNGDVEILETRVRLIKNPVNCVPVGFCKGTYLLKDLGFSFTEDTIRTGVEIAVPEKTRRFSSSLFGPQHAYAFAFAVAIGDILGIEDEKMQKALETVKPFPGRGVVRKSSSGIWCIDETYNANPLSMRQALMNLSALPREGRKFAVLGGMKELGDHTHEWHREILKAARNLDFDGVLLLGQEWTEALSHVKDSGKIRHYQNISAVSSTLDKVLSTGDILLLKGSRAYGLEKILVETRCLQ
ncbi:MAG: UDP-N-acetylmuramoyl-tripeptide--D-alanyl-D-alanine ligase [Thermovirgaceae bacterium]